MTLCREDVRILWESQFQRARPGAECRNVELIARALIRHGACSSAGTHPGDLFISNEHRPLGGNASTGIFGTICGRVLVPTLVRRLIALTSPSTKRGFGELYVSVLFIIHEAHDPSQHRQEH